MTSTQATWSLGRAATSKAATGPAGWTSRILSRVDLWIERHRQRASLSELNDALLKDIGISRADAQGEADKPFWRP
jgi:uncharacterized protein YjiS (DUF1127 family)